MRWFSLLLLAFAGCQVPHVSISSTGDLSEPDGRATVVVSRSDSLARNVGVGLEYSGTSTEPTDYVGSAKTVSVTPGGSATVLLRAIDDKIREPDKTLTVSIAPSSDYQIGPVGSVTIQAKDDDPETPPPTEAPWESPGLSVLILRESQATGDLPVAQRAILTSTAVHEWLQQHAVKLSDGQPGYRIWDNDADPANAPTVMQGAYKAVKAKMQGEAPLIGVSNGKTGFVGPLPGNVEETLALLDKYK